MGLDAWLSRVLAWLSMALEFGHDSTPLDTPPSAPNESVPLCLHATVVTPREPDGTSCLVWKTYKTSLNIIKCIWELTASNSIQQSRVGYQGHLFMESVIYNHEQHENQERIYNEELPLQPLLSNYNFVKFTTQIPIILSNSSKQILIPSVLMVGKEQLIQADPVAVF